MVVERVVAVDLAENDALAPPELRDPSHAALILELDLEILEVRRAVVSRVDPHDLHAHSRPFLLIAQKRYYSLMDGARR